MAVDRRTSGRGAKERGHGQLASPHTASPGPADTETDKHVGHPRPQFTSIAEIVDQDRQGGRDGIAAIAETDRESMSIDFEGDLELVSILSVAWCFRKSSMSCTVKPAVCSTISRMS